MTDISTSTEPGSFDEWAAGMRAIYSRGDASEWPDAVKVEWEQAWEQMSKAFPHLLLTWMDPSCGCCTLVEPALLAFDDPQGPIWFEVLYPTFKPIHTRHLG